MRVNLNDYKKASSYYHSELAPLDEILYQLCKKYPDHSKKSHIHAKLWIIGRTYATGIERQIKSSGEQGSSLTKLEEHLYKNRKKVDAIFKRLLTISEPLNADKLKTIAREHGKFVNLIAQKLRNNQTSRSFVSKYMHFHCKAVPIYDSLASKELRSLYPWDNSYEVFDLPVGADEEYCDFTFRFWQLYQELHRTRKKGSVKLLDNYLLWRTWD